MVADTELQMEDDVNRSNPPIINIPDTAESQHDHEDTVSHQR